MNLNHDAHSSPKEENYLNGSIDDFTDCIDFTKHYQKSCGFEDSFDEENNLNSSTTDSKEQNNSDLGQKEENGHCKSLGGSNECLRDSDSNNEEKGKKDFENERHPMEPDVSITVGESELEKTINHVAKNVDGSDEKPANVEPSEVSNIKPVKPKAAKKNHLKLPVNKNIKRKTSLFKLKNGKYVKKKNESFHYQGIQSNIKFKCYKCSYSDFSSISELQAHQRKCITGTPDFQQIHEPPFGSPSSSNFRITRKVYLCSACGTYYENWNLFLHMKEIHNRHICLYCLGMFSQPDKLAQHLQAKHNVVEHTLSSPEEFLKTYRGSCYLVCVTCEAMFSEQEDFREHSCNRSQSEDAESCPLCGLRGAHFPTCRRAFSDRYSDPDGERFHPALGKKFPSKKKKAKTSKKTKEVFRIVNNEHNGEMSVIVRKQSSDDGGTKNNGDRTPGVGPGEDLVSAKQYNEKMLQLYRPNKPPEKVISSIQSIEDSINRVVENSRISDEAEKGNEEEEEEEEEPAPELPKEEEEEPEEDDYQGDEERGEGEDEEEASVNEKESSFERQPSADFGEAETSFPNEETAGSGEKETWSSSDNGQTEPQNPAPVAVENGESQALSECESTDSEKLTIAFDQPPEHSTQKREIKEGSREPSPAADTPEDHVPTAPADTPYILVPPREELEDAKSMIKEFVKVSCWNCVYCSHAKRIAVNGKQLALHVLAEHKFATVSKEATDEEKEESYAKIVLKLKSSLPDLEQCYFNTDTFDSADKEFWKANDRIYECFHCLFATYVHKELYSHNRKMHQKTVFLCIMCKSNFYNYSELLCHLCPGIYISGQVINPDITYRCFLCNVDPLPSSFRLMVHLRRRHNSCDICFDQSSNQFQLSTHVWKHKLSHMCYRCGIAYRNKPDITKHLFWKHGTESVLCKKCLQKKWPHVYHFCVPPNSFVCDECSVSLKSAVALKVHKRLHSGDYPYSCTKCEEKFISRKLLAKHLDKHDEEANRPREEETPEPEPEPEKSTPLPEDNKSFEAETNGSEDPEKKPEKEKKPKKRKVLTDVFDLPPVNLSESDDSDQEEPEPKKKVPEPEQTPAEEPLIPNGYLNGDLQKDDVAAAPPQIVDGVWNDFQNYLVAKDKPKTFRGGSPFKNMTLSRIKEIMLSDHDYHIIPSSGSSAPKAEPEKTTKKAGLDHDYCNNVPKTKKSKQKTKHRENASKSSSSDSSSDSDSSCSCGSNCSCSSGSSSSSSSESDSDSREKRKQKESPERTVKDSNEADGEAPAEVDIFVHDVPVENMIRESDLETDETETDEDFYDYNPAREANRILAEKRTQLLANLNGSDRVATSPSVPPEKPQNPKKKSKFKKRRSQPRVGVASRGGRKKAALPVVPPGHFEEIPAPEPAKPFVSTPDVPVTPVQAYSRPRTEESVEVSDSKRPKRKRVPLKFYGFSSDDESEGVQGPRKREKSEHNTTTPVDPTPEPPPSIWNPHSKNSLSWRVEKSDGAPPKVNPIKIRTSQSGARYHPTAETVGAGGDDGGNAFQIKRPDRSFQVNGNPSGQKNEKLYCFCQCPYDEVSEMIACDAEDCVIEWFHFECVGIMVPPKGSWYCPDCRKKLAAENEFLSPPAGPDHSLS